jgi:hypothetical protein
MAEREMHPNSLANLNPPQRPGDPPLNPSGKPKGSHSVRTALKRMLREGWETDTDHEDGEKLGLVARKWAKDVAQAIDEGDADKIRSIASIIDQVEGKPTETRINKGSGKLVVVLDSLAPDDNPEELPPGCE